MSKIVEPIQIEISLDIMFQTVNCYLLPVEEQLTLIDCGLYSEKNWEDFQKKINDLGFQVSDIEQVIITHEHRDHIGLLPEIMNHSDAVIRVPQSIKDWFYQPVEMRKKVSTFNEKLFSELGFPKEQLEQVFQYLANEDSGRVIEDMDRLEFFEAGDFLQIGNSDWEVLHTPGHCPTQYVFLQEEEKRIFGSDMLLPIAPMPIVMEDANNPGQPTASMNDLLNSFERLKEFEIEKVYPGHGLVFEDANAMINKQLARIEVRKNECLEAIKDGFNTPYLINRKMYPYQQMPPDFSGMFMILGYLDILIQEGRISRTSDFSPYTFSGL